jgi:hypothetical protein
MKRREDERSDMAAQTTVTSRLPPPGVSSDKTPFCSTTPDSYNLPYMPATTAAAAPAAPADLLKQIDERLKSLRAELAEHDPSLLLARPATAPAGGRRGPQSAIAPGACMWPSFQTRQTRAAATAAAAAAKKSSKDGTSGGGGGTGVKYRGKAAPRPRPPAPGQRPGGYLILSKYSSTPAYTIRQKIVLSRDVDPMLPDDNPGPGEYDTLKY